MDDTLPTDDYSKTLRSLVAHPGAVERASTIELTDFYGNQETWVVKTVRVDGRDTVFLQRINAGGGSRWVLPAEITDAISRQRDSAVSTIRKRAARAGAATRRAAKK